MVPERFYDCFSFWDRRRGVAFSDSHEGVFTLLRTEDGGETWMPSGGQALGGVVYGGSVVPGAPTPTLVAAGPSGTAWSDDGGFRWRTFSDAETWGVTFLAPAVGWGVGRGHISRFRPD